MRRTALYPSVWAALLGCGGAPTPAPEPSKAAAPPVGVPVAAALPAAPRPWGPAFSHACAGDGSPVLVAPDGKSIAFCSARYDAERGTFAGAAVWGTHALLTDGRVLGRSDEYAWTVAGADGKVLASSKGQSSTELAVSPNGTKLAVLEDDEIVVRSIDGLKDIARVQPGEVSPKPVLGFLADERAVVLLPTDCTTKRHKRGRSSWEETTCDGRRFFAVGASGLEPLFDADDVERVAFASGGGRVLVQRSNGRREVLALPGGEPFAELPAVTSGEANQPLALSPSGDRAAIVTDDVVIFSVAGGASREITRIEGAEPDALVFAPDGSALYLATHRRVLAWREGATERPVPVPRYEATPPKGFLAARAACTPRGEAARTEDDDRCRAAQLGLRDGGLLTLGKGNEMMMPEGHVKAFVAKDELMEVYVTAHDASAFAGLEGKAWAERAIHADPMGTIYGARDSLRMRGDRAFYYSQFRREGCDPLDAYVHVIERDGLLYFVRIEVAPDYPQKKLAPLFRAFVDEPFGSDGEEARTLEKPPGRPEGPC